MSQDSGVPSAAGRGQDADARPMRTPGPSPHRASTADRPAAGGTRASRGSVFRVGFHFVPIPREMVREKKVSRGAFYLYAVLWDLSDWNTRELAMQQKDIAVAADCKVRALQVHLGELVEAGYIRLEYDRSAHRQTIYLGEQAQENAPADAENCASQAQESALRSTSSDSNTQTRTSATRDRKDPRRARAFLERFGAWYLRVYGRPHSSADAGQMWATDALLRRVEKDRLRVPAINESTAESVVGAVLCVALRRRAQIWFLRNGEPLCLDEILNSKKWQILWDAMLAEAQERGFPTTDEEFGGHHADAGAAA